MIRPSRVRLVVWRASVVMVGLLAVATAATARQRSAPAGRPDQAPRPEGGQPKVNSRAAALQEFQKRLDQYLELRSALASKLKPLSTTPSAAELGARQDALAAGIKTARANARRGDLIPPGATQVIAVAVRDDFKRRNPTARMGVFEEVPAKPGASLVNRTYPASDPLPTVPPLLLMNLPRLPDNLQYRFAGRDVVILDADVQVVIDYIQNVLPPH